MEATGKPSWITSDDAVFLRRLKINFDLEDCRPTLTGVVPGELDVKERKFQAQLRARDQQSMAMSVQRLNLFEPTASLRAVEPLIRT